LRDILGVPCSRQVEEDARRLGIPLTTLDEYPVVDLTIDNADEVDPDLNVIKGGGGALLREKIVAQASRREIIVVDESKLSPALDTRWPVPAARMSERAGIVEHGLFLGLATDVIVAGVEGVCHLQRKT